MHHSNAPERTVITAPDGCNIGYTRKGRRGGKPVGMMVGTFGSGEQTVEAHAPAADMDIDLVALDPPGRGLSDPVDTYDLERARLHMRVVMDGLGWDSAILVGASGGSIPALGVASAMPKRTKGVVLLSPIGPPSEEEIYRHLPRKSRLAFSVAQYRLGALALTGAFQWKLRGFRKNPEALLQELVNNFGPADQELFSVSQGMRNTLTLCLRDIAEGQDGARSIVQALQLACRAQWEELMPAEHIPVHILHGKDDAFVPLAIAGSIRKRLRANLTIVPGGHFTAVQDHHLRMAFGWCREMAEKGSER